MTFAWSVSWAGGGRCDLQGLPCHTEGAGTCGTELKIPGVVLSRRFCSQGSPHPRGPSSTVCTFDLPPWNAPGTQCLPAPCLFPPLSCPCGLSASHSPWGHPIPSLALHPQPGPFLEVLRVGPCSGFGGVGCRGGTNHPGFRHPWGDRWLPSAWATPSCLSGQPGPSVDPSVTGAVRNLTTVGAP